MKKIIIIMFLTLITTACTNINNLEFDSMVNTILTSKIELHNQYRTGYKYYLPRNLNIINKTEFNEKIVSSKHTYYLYIDAISYYNDVENTYKVNEEAYFSNNINYNNLYGYLEINEIENNYLVELMYNYAKIEVMTNKDDLNLVISNSLILLSSINYNKQIINNLIGENILTSNEKNYNIFETKKTESKFIEYLEQYDHYNTDKNPIPDIDLIN